MPVTHDLGPLTVVALHDGEGTFFQPRQEAFPQVNRELWARADERDPGAVTADSQWLLRFRCFAVRHGDRVTLVDTGIGPADSLAASWAPVPGRLPEELAAAGIDPAGVDTVVLSHLHTDHIGWAVVGTPYFPNATYLLQRADAEAFDRPELRDRLIRPLTESGQLRLIEGDVPIAAGVTAIATPGHTPGHQSVLVEYGSRQTLITGDLLVHMVQLVAPRRRTRTRWIRRRRGTPERSC
ncbi:MBL fold metallo-hydrolase [Phytohabitans suffuscus]|uniref:MBL fold metallo-hydrolase n=1 Tax=Phytohabitans suffuscus TaxID=624315 RepID=A0A6F8YLD8_9ACTN|nr:MBL fold metallo-hydrolase [Phytohabitans suffuscus]BCB86876.1 MBL fold metallo-hydrolase [Phytohabitans suffuscus]